MRLYLFVAVTLLSFRGECFSKQVVEIGIASNFSELTTVSLNPYGGYFRDAVTLAIKDNQKSLDKANIDLRIKELDLGNSDINVMKIAEDASRTKMIAVLGYNYSSGALLAAPVHVKAKLPMFSPGASANRLGTFGRYIHLDSINNEFMAKAIAKVAYEQLHFRKVISVTAVDCAYCVDGNAAFVKEFTHLGGLIVKNISVMQEDTEFSEAAGDARKLKFDAIFNPNQELAAARIISAFTDGGIQKTFLGTDGWGNDGTEFFRVLKGRNFKGYSVTHWHPLLNTKKSKKFVHNYMSNFKKFPNDTSALVYDSMSILIKALVSLKNPTRESLEDSLSSLREFSGVTGRSKLQPNLAPQKDIILLQTSNSSFVISKEIKISEAMQ